MIEAEGLTKRYGDTVALAGIGLQVSAGSILGVLGPNGAGKTTAVRILTTLSRPDSGTRADRNRGHREHHQSQPRARLPWRVLLARPGQRAKGYCST